MKNVVDVVLGGLTYWAFGYGLSYGDSPLSNSFVALGTVAGGTWFVDATGEDMGPTFVTFLFQLSFATTATTIVSGAIAERCERQNHLPFCTKYNIVYIRKCDYLGSWD